MSTSDTDSQIQPLPNGAKPSYTDTMGKKTTTELVAFRLDEDLIKKLDAYAASVAAANPGLKPTRTDAVRMLLLQALETATAKRKGKR